ncbi:hypothetical protein AM501_28590 [Aneurinibacillus migulanus]|uniref:AAA family ATPase n=1 Tax=Aneurinibacillus migulanus TaxID=47500 RepID=UPI0005BD9F0A|nr:AAA family ATPase [Aneurinibacillus migulanus]KIV58379.1 hypothetical protein TS64_04800 [Aneurinibacillus migulanus]KPD05008.1 hypothetical protein AM501_28590 [Aneurinibacillus migulanus]
MPIQTKQRYAPIRLLSIESEGFSYFPRQEVLIHESITGVVGENGSGKTTFLNMFRLLFGAERFDNEHTLRTFFSREDIYEIYIVGKFDNTLQPKYDKRPFEPVGKYSEVVSVVCRLTLDDPRVKRSYLIYDGEFDLDIHLKNTFRWLEVTQYQKQMEEVGMSRALVRAFSLNQGNTEEILKKSEEELAEYLLEICGEQERIDNFNNLKVDMKRQKEQYAALLQQKEMEEAHTQRLRERIERCKKILEKEDNLAKFKFDLPLSIVNENCKELEKYKKKLNELDALFYQLTTRIHKLEEERQKKQQRLKILDSDYTTIKQQISNLLQQKEEVNHTLSLLCNEITELEKFLQQYKDIELIHQSVLEQEKETNEKQYSHSLANLVVVEKEKQSLEERICKSEKSGTIEFPLDVQKMMQILNDKKVDYLLVADYIEILDEEWREAIEGLLGQERFTIVVSQEHMIEVMKWAQEFKYPYWISPFKPAKLEFHSKSVLKKINILDERIAGYLEKFQHYMVSETMEEAWNWVQKGNSALLNKPYVYKVISRGGRFIKTNGKYCGKLAFQAQMEDSKRELKALMPLYNNLIQQVKQHKSILDETLEKIKVQEKARMVPEKVRILEQFKGQENKVLITLNEIGENLNDSERKRDNIVNSKLTLSNELGEIIGTLKEINNRKNVVSTDIQLQQEMVEDSKQKLFTSEEQLTDGQKTLLKDKSYLSELSPSSYYKTEINTIKEIINQLREKSFTDHIIPGEEKRMIGLEQKYKYHQKMLKQHMEEIGRVQTELDQLDQKHRVVQAEYHLMVEEVFLKIKHSLEKLCKNGNIRADLRAFHIGEDRWKVDYRIGFHGKDLKSYREKTRLSGGQKVIASLLLTFAAIKSDGALSFMILDEPFAHLDHERISLAGEFLKQTGVQFIIAMPYSENVKLLMPWVDMLINFRAMKPGEVIAPPMMYGVVNDEYIRKRNVI